MRLPGLPVSRRRHEVFELRTALAGARGGQAGASQRAAIYQRKHNEAREALMAAEARVAELQRERRERENLLDHWQHRVAELEQAIREHARQPLDAQGDDTMATLVHAMRARDRRLHAVLDGHDRQERGDVPVTYQDGERYRLNRRQPESTAAGPPDLPEPPPAEPDRDLIGHMEQPNTRRGRRVTGEEPGLSDCQTCGQPLGEGSVHWLGEGRGFRHPTCPDPLPPREGRNDPPNVWSQGIPAGQHDLAGQPCATCGAPLRSEGSVARFNTQARWSHKPCLDGVARREREGGRR